MLAEVLALEKRLFLSDGENENVWSSSSGDKLQLRKTSKILVFPALNRLDFFSPLVLSYIPTWTTPTSPNGVPSCCLSKPFRVATDGIADSI